ncbi:MAG TPA: M14 family zinc carboxypeptidase [Flavisolibacter sp.]|nr:M14 family zinc carboxypeptidase [Flavisolibacter sp.]
MKTIICIVVFVCAFGTAGQAQSKHSQVKIFIPKNRTAALQKQGFDFDHSYYNPTDQSLTTTLDANDLAILAKSGYPYEVIVEDEEKDFLIRNKPEEFFKNDDSRGQGNNSHRLFFNSPDKAVASTIVTPAAFHQGSMGGYLTYAEMKKELDSMVLNYPTLVKLESIGKTYENRDIWVLKISDNAAANESEPEVLYSGMHHAREPLGMMNLIFYMQYLLENYSINDRIKEIVDGRELYFIPIVNPDGYVYNQSTNPNGGGLWRKNRQPNTSDGSIGQDLNRNYAFGFDYNNGGSSDVTTDQTYHGDFAFSAIETQLMRDYIRTRDFKFALNYHSYGGYWIHGYCVPTGVLSATDVAIIKTTGSIATKHSIYEVGTPMETVGYQGNGSSDDWFLGGDAGVRPPIYAISPEVGLGITTFWPVASDIIKYCKEVFHGNLQTALLGGSYTIVEDKSSMALVNTTGSLEFIARRVGRVDDAVKVTLVPLENIASVGAPVNIASLPNYLSTAQGSISYTLAAGISNGQRIKFAWKTEFGGVTKLDTFVKFYNPTVLLSDDMESGTVGAAGGKWTNTTGTSWGYSTASANSGTRALSESAAGNYTASNTLTINSAAAVNLADATFAYLSFWTRYRTQNGYDKLQVQVSTNGTTYTALPGLHTIVETKGTLAGAPSFTGYQDYWVREVIDLSSVKGAAAVRLRFAFTSDASTHDDGFYIDDVQLIKTATPLVVLPVNFLTVRAIKADAEVLVQWEANTDLAHSYFEAEHSADGINFTSFSRIEDKGQVFTVADKNPFSGKTYYRVKAVSQTGQFQYSKIISIESSSLTNLQLYPNPVKNTLQLQVSSLKPGKYQYQILSALGQVVNYNEFNLQSGSERFAVSTEGIGQGKYQLCLRNEKGEVVAIKGFVKL